MQRKSWLFTGFSFIMGAFAMFLRWLQQLNCFEEDTGLFISGSPITKLLVIVLVLAAAGLWLFSSLLQRGNPITEPERVLRLDKPLVSIIAGAAAVLVFVGGIKLCFDALKMDSMRQTYLILALLTVASAISLFVVVRQLEKGRSDSAVRLGYAVIILFYCYWIIIDYKSNASDPVVWAYAPEILTLASSVLAFYFLAGYSFGAPKPREAIFFSEFTFVLTMASLVDERSTAQNLMLVAPAILLYVIAWLVIYNTANGEKAE